MFLFAPMDGLGVGGLNRKICASLPFHGSGVFLPTKQLQKQAIQWCHTDMVSGHPGLDKTIEVTTRKFWWPTIRKDVKEWVRECEVCARAKHKHTRAKGLLLPLPTPTGKGIGGDRSGCKTAPPEGSATQHWSSPTGAAVCGKHSCVRRSYVTSRVRVHGSEGERAEVERLGG